jgi:hypothetical protein
MTGILLTRVAFKTCSGLPGVVITCIDSAKSSPSSIVVVGPPKLGLFMNALAAYSDFVLKGLQLNVEVRPLYCSLPLEFGLVTAAGKPETLSK